MNDRDIFRKTVLMELADYKTYSDRRDRMLDPYEWTKYSREISQDYADLQMKEHYIGATDENIDKRFGLVSLLGRGKVHLDLHPFEKKYVKY